MRDSEDFIIFWLFSYCRLNMKSMFHRWNMWPVQLRKLLRDKKMYCHTNYRDKVYNFIEVFLVKDKSRRDICLMMKKHLEWRLIITADKRSQFTATRTKNNKNRRFYSTEDTLKLHKHHTKTSWRLALTYFHQYVSNSFLSVQRNSICCFDYA